MDFLKRTWAEIHLERLGINIANYCACLQGETKLLCVVKASCYGHADLAICPYLEKELGVKWFAVSNSDEALRHPGYNRRELRHRTERLSCRKRQASALSRRR